MSDSRRDDLVVIPALSGALEADEATGDRLEAARASRRRRRAVFDYRIAGVNLRAGKLPRQLISAWANGTVNLMLGMLLNGELVPGTAKEAADVAKIAHEIAEKASGRPNDNASLTPAERQAREDAAEELGRKLSSRARELGREANDRIGGGPIDEDDEPPEVDRWEHEETPVTAPPSA